MKSALLVVLLAAAATAAEVSNEEPEVMEVPDADTVPNVDVDELPDVLVTYGDELVDAAGPPDDIEEPVQTAVDTRRNLNQGSIGSKDVRVLNGEYKANGVKGRYHVKNMRVSTNRRITAVRVNRVGNSQGATPSITGGGIGKSFIAIRIRSAVGRGYHYRVQVYAR